MSFSYNPEKEATNEVPRERLYRIYNGVANLVNARNREFAVPEPTTPANIQTPSEEVASNLTAAQASEVATLTQMRARSDVERAFREAA